MELRAHITYRTAATNDQVDDLLDRLLAILPKNGPVITTTTDTLTVTIAYDDIGPWAPVPQLPTIGDAVARHVPAAGLPIRVDVVSAAALPAAA